MEGGSTRRRGHSLADLTNSTNSSDQDLKDARDLADLGHEQTLSRKFSTWSMFFLAFSVLGTWSTFAMGLNSGLTSGGPIVILWGLVLVAICNLCVATSLGELCSSMPTALGQAFWISRLCPGKWGRFVSYMCAWVNTFGWWTLSASQLAFMTNFILSMKVLFVGEWEPATTGWVNFLLYLGVTLFVTLVNLVACRRDFILPWFNNFVGVCFITLFFVFSLALLITVGVRNNLRFQPGSFVFGEWINQTPWNGGVTFFMGLVQAAYGLTAFDSAVHLTEEIPRPRSNIPRVIWLSVLMGSITGFIFMVVCLFCIQDLDRVIEPSTGLPFMDLLADTIGLEGATVLLSLFIFNGMGQAVSILTTASRLTWGFARDGGLPFSGFFSAVNDTWHVPARALWLQGGIIGLVGVLYTFSNTVLDAILGVATIALTISYGLPIAALLIAGRDKLPPGGEFSLGDRFGPLINWVSVVYCAVTTVFFFFPGEPNPAPADMNYAIAVFGIMLIVSLGLWVVKGRKTYLQTTEAKERIMDAIRGELGQYTEGVEDSTLAGNGEKEKPQ
jgi:choline transport protein